LKSHPDTLLVVTADHETGNFAFGYNVLNIPDEENVTGKAFENKSYKRAFNYGRANTLDKIYLQKTSLKELWERYEKLDRSQKNPNGLRELVLDITGYEISLEKATQVLTEVPNPNFSKWHKVLNYAKMPVVNDFKEFYYDPDVTKICLIGRAIGPAQSVTWGTGGHTATPVGVFSQGPAKALTHIKGFTNHRELGKSLQAILGL
jgi:alkaline phosphatase